MQHRRPEETRLTSCGRWERLPRGGTELSLEGCKGVCLGAAGMRLGCGPGPFVRGVVSVTVSFWEADAVSTEGGWLLASLLSVMFKVSGPPAHGPHGTGASGGLPCDGPRLTSRATRKGADAWGGGGRRLGDGGDWEAGFKDGRGELRGCPRGGGHRGQSLLPALSLWVVKSPRAL